MSSNVATNVVTKSTKLSEQGAVAKFVETRLKTAKKFVSSADAVVDESEVREFFILLLLPHRLHSPVSRTLLVVVIYKDLIL